MAIISNNEIARAIYLSVKGKHHAEQSVILKNVPAFLKCHRVLSKSGEILALFKKIVNEDDGVVEVKVFSKDKISNEAKHDLTQILKKRYGNKEFVFIESLDEKLLGGLKIEVRDELIDLTLKNKIYKLQEYLTENYE